MKQKLFTALFICAFLNLPAQTDNYRQELQNLVDISRLSLYRAGDIEQLSSYDRTGGNDDGFSGKYSSIRKDPEGLVIADLKGPGVVNRIWTPTPDADTVKFYFDGEKTPRISIPVYRLVYREKLSVCFAAVRKPDWWLLLLPPHSLRKIVENCVHGQESQVSSNTVPEPDRKGENEIVFSRCAFQLQRYVRKN